MMLWSKSACALFGLLVRVSGQPPDRHGLFIAGNHSSYTDIPVMGSLIPAVFVAKHEVKSWFLFGSLARMGGSVFVKRESGRSTLQAVEEVQQRIKAGVNVIVFPEGTTDNGRQVTKFGSSFFKIPAEADIPVLPLSIYYAYVDGRPTTEGPVNEMAWHNVPLFPHLMNLLSKKTVEVRVHFGEVIDNNISPEHFRDRKALAETAFHRVREGFEIAKKQP